MKTVTVQLIKKTVTGQDDFGADIVSEETIDVPGCLVGSPTSDDVITSTSIYGKTCAYVIGVPKGDSNDWTDTEVIIEGERYRTIGYPMTGIQENIPLKWGKNVKVERYG